MSVKLNNIIFIDDDKNLLVNTAYFTGNTHIKIPVGNTSQRTANPEQGNFRLNTDLNKPELFILNSWVALGSGGGGGATGGGVDSVFYENDQIVKTSYSITAGKSAMSTGPITVNNGVIVTVPSGSRWVIL